MTFPVLYSSDVHGNAIQYAKLVRYALDQGHRCLILGGDVLPKYGSLDARGRPVSIRGAEDFIRVQRRFVEDQLPALVEPLAREGIGLYLLLGNDDCAANLDALERGEPGLYRLIHRKRFRLNADFDLAGLGTVPITPFGIKDWEEYEFSSPPRDLAAAYLARKADPGEYNLEGRRSTPRGWKDFRFTPQREKTVSLQRILEDPVFDQGDRRTCYVIHCPPFDTRLDLISPGFGPDTGRRKHVGSMAVRRFIEERRPYLTLHGHIHETVELSGDFRDRIGTTPCLCSGNFHDRPTVAAVEVDLYSPLGARRIIL